MAQSILLSKENPNWLTPEKILAPSRACLDGRIDVDPASCAVANVAIGAKVFYDGSPNCNGLDYNWVGNVFLNPPGGVIEGHTRTRSKPVAWWLELCNQQYSGYVDKAIFLAFAAGSFFQAVQKSRGFGNWWDNPLSYNVCFLKDRIRFELTRADKLAMLKAELASFWPVINPSDKQVKRFYKLSKQMEEVEFATEFARFPGPSPTHGNAIIGLGIDRKLFSEQFSNLGICHLV